MPGFTDEQKTAIAEIVTASFKAASDKSAQDLEKGKIGVVDGKNVDEAGKSKTVTQEAKEALDAENTAKIAIGQISESVKFNLSVKDFLEKNKTLLPDEAAKILPAIAAKTFKDENEKAYVLKKKQR